MERIRLSTVGGVCAIAAVVCFGLGAVFLASAGVQVLIPETEREARNWMADVGQARGLFSTAAWLFILMGFLAIGAFVGFYDALRHAGPVMLLALVTGAVGLTLVTVSHLIPIAMAYELVPAYTGANAARQATLGVTADTLAATALVINAAGNFLGWGIATPMFAAAVLVTRALPRWLGWLGLVVGFLAGWLGLLSPGSNVISAIASLGFLGFFVFLLGMGVALLRRRATAPEPTPAST